MSLCVDTKLWPHRACRMMFPNLKALCKYRKTSQVYLQPHSSHANRHSVTTICIESTSGEVISVFLDVFQHNLTAGNKVSQHYVTGEISCTVPVSKCVCTSVHTHRGAKKPLPVRLQYSIMPVLFRELLLIWTKM